MAAGTLDPATVRTAMLAAAVAVVPLSLLSGLFAGCLHLVAVASAWAYNLRLKATPLSVLPYAVSFGLLPAFVTAGLPGQPVVGWLVAAGALLGAGAHFANVLPDIDDDLRHRRARAAAAARPGRQPGGRRRAAAGRLGGARGRAARAARACSGVGRGARWRVVCAAVAGSRWLGCWWSPGYAALTFLGGPLVAADRGGRRRCCVGLRQARPLTFAPDLRRVGAGSGRR